jgi:hypothetical protein
MKDNVPEPVSADLGQGKMEVEGTPATASPQPMEGVTESTSPFDAFIKKSLKILQENKF